MRLRYALALMTAFATSSAGAQAPAAPGRAIATPPGEIRGRLVDSASQRAVATGSITVRRAGDTSFAGGALPRPDGSFRVDGLLPGRYVLRVRALGFAAFAKNDIVISAQQPLVDVGALGLSVVAAKLSGQDVVAERDEQVLAPDRNVYSTKNMATASGGTAIDVLRNIPLVEVSGTNTISLRGNGNVVIQINGRSTPLKGNNSGRSSHSFPRQSSRTSRSQPIRQRRMIPKARRASSTSCSTRKRNSG